MDRREELIQAIIRRCEAEEITERDLREFLNKPHFWCRDFQQLEPGLERTFWQSAYDELGVRVDVPDFPQCPDALFRLLERYHIMPFYFPKIEEKDFPEGFIKPDWKRFLRTTEIERLPLSGRWALVETWPAPEYPFNQDPDGPGDRFFTVGAGAKEILIKIPAGEASLLPQAFFPSLEEYNWMGNVFRWLRANRGMTNLPLLGSTRAWEWCRNASGRRRQLITGHVEHGGIADVHDAGEKSKYGDFAFRLIFPF